MKQTGDDGLVEVVYVGPFDEVTVPDLGVVAVRDVPVQVTVDAAAGLVAQTDWRMR